MDEPVDRYANAMMMRGGAFDVVIEFSIDTPIGDVKPGQMPPIERGEITRIRMSWSHLKTMAPVIVEQIRSIEAQIGPINLPPELQERYDRCVKP